MPINFRKPLGGCWGVADGVAERYYCQERRPFPKILVQGDPVYRFADRAL